MYRVTLWHCAANLSLRLWCVHTRLTVDCILIPDNDSDVMSRMCDSDCGPAKKKLRQSVLHFKRIANFMACKLNSHFKTNEQLTNLLHAVKFLQCLLCIPFAIKINLIIQQEPLWTSKIQQKPFGSRGSAPDPAGGAHNAPADPKLNPRRLANVVLAPYDLRQSSSRIALPKLWSPSKQHGITQ